MTDFLKGAFFSKLLDQRKHERTQATLSMTPMMFYLGALGLFGLGSLFIRNTAPYRSSGGGEYERRRKRRLMGKILMGAATLPVAMGMMSQFVSRNAPAINPPPPRGSAGQPPIAPIILAPHQAFQPSGQTPEINSTPASSGPGQPPAVPVAYPLRQVVELMEQNQYDAALDHVNAAIRAAPQDPAAYALRGDIYAAQKLWDRAEKDYQTVLHLDGTSVQIKFNLAEIEFLQKKYDAARPGFAALEQLPDMGDLAAYKVFQCDLFGGHEHTAAQELDAFNQVGSNASYYFANASWSLYHHQTEDARGWLTSAANIYAPDKFGLYAASLIDLGYMPLPPPPPQQ